MTSLHELRELPKEGDFFLSFDDLLEVIRDASIKDKFSFKNPHKERATGGCRGTSSSRASG